MENWLNPYLESFEAFQRVLELLTGPERSMEHPLIPRRHTNSSRIVRKFPIPPTPRLGRFTLPWPRKIISKVPVQAWLNPYLEPFEAFQRVVKLLTGPERSLEHPLIPQRHTNSSRIVRKFPTPPIPQLGRLTVPGYQAKSTMPGYQAKSTMLAGNGTRR